MTFEVRYDEAFMLWDISGRLWQSVQRQFKAIRSTQATPNQTAFIGDNRFVMTVSLDRAIITDHKPTGGSGATVEVMSKFLDAVVKHLQIAVFNRVGTRAIFSLKCKSPEDARTKLAEALPLNIGGTTTFFNVKPTNVAPHLKLDVSDGELGYSVQFHLNEKKFDFQPPPDLSAFNLDAQSETLDELVLDIDLFTKKPLPVESFDAEVWLNGCNKAILRDTDQFLDRLKNLR